ncbi:MAG: hypothetical protein ACRDWN_06755 [Acidimicrobiales bacterium]
MLGPQDAIDNDDQLWRAQHGACRAGRNGYTNAPLHCLRCCGTPPASPEQLAIVGRFIQQVAAREERDRQLAAAMSPEAERRQQEQRALTRARWIKKLEAKLQRLRDEETGHGDG